MSINAQVLAVAGMWIGTPYRHQGAVKGVGCDCLGLVRGIWRELYGQEPEAVPAYAPDWAERGGEERLLAAAARHFLSVPSFAESRPGDLVLFRFRPHLAAKHAGILARLPDECSGTDGAACLERAGAVPIPDAFIHAYEQSAVTLSALVPGWRRKIAGIYRFPERI
ncbi:NlpC/P60 family putative phage cell wall peptidase [Rhizobium rosettiformans]|uniref:Peptidase n=2 Tax=Rhizobium rosettiformans TaxID=1368430 RepID=A0A4S8Q623_9HYPH|nr:peptidase [Rhizobium rosettiformans]MBB5274230.1 NlpC/P60 family putative phage cell wall peptidase [Rhizobium rosettiformans]THV38125.1 peptidase [Rhizobium rosettiformans W3]